MSDLYTDVQDFATRHARARATWRNPPLADDEHDQPVDLPVRVTMDGLSAVGKVELQALARRVVEALHPGGTVPPDPLVALIDNLRQLPGVVVSEPHPGVGGSYETVEDVGRALLLLLDATAKTSRPKRKPDAALNDQVQAYFNAHRDDLQTYTESLAQGDTKTASRLHRNKVGANAISISLFGTNKKRGEISRTDAFQAAIGQLRRGGRSDAKDTADILSRTRKGSKRP